MIADTVISVCALGLTLWGIREGRRQNKLAARPHLVAHRKMDWNDDGCVFTYELCNHGFGPARLKKFILLLDDKPFECPKGKDLVDEFFANRLSGKFEYSLPSTGVPNGGYSILPGHTYQVVKLLIPGLQRSEQSKLDGVFNGMDLRVEYESFHEEEFVFDTRNKVNDQERLKP